LRKIKIDLNKHYKVAEFLKNEFDNLKNDAEDKKIKTNFYKQKKLKGKIEKLLLKVEGIILKVDSLEEKTMADLKILQSQIKECLEK